MSLWHYLKTKISEFWNPKECWHSNSEEIRWLDGDQTPMVHWRCLDCGASEKGHVHMPNTDGWPGKTTIRNGMEV